MPRRPATLSRRDLKAINLWTARMLASEDGGETPYAEPIKVTIVKRGAAESIEVRPGKDADGMITPECLAVTRGRDPAVTPADPDEMLSLMFSRDEIRILSQMVAANETRTTRAKSVQEATKIPEGKFWVLWSNLQQRGVVVDATEGEGFEIGPAWVAEWVRKREGVAAA